MKFYAVKIGNQPGVYENWEECQKAVAKFPKADFKSFLTREEAQAYIDGKDLFKEVINKDLDNDFIVAFTDGSYEEKLKKYSYGVLIISKDFKEYELCGSGETPNLLKSRNVAGEVFGVINALDWAISNNHSKIKIYHDYEGLSKWYSGEWKGDSEIAKFYLERCERKYKDIIEVVFEKVKGHSNNIYNDKVDKLAKSALFDNKIETVKGNNWFTISNIQLINIENIIDSIKNDNPSINLKAEDDSMRRKFELSLEKNNLAITFFKTKNNLLIQGKMTILFQMVLSYLTETIGEQNIIQIFKDAYRKTIKQKEMEVEFNTILEKLPNDYPENNKCLIRQAIINIKYYVVSEDYSQYAFPALKALEGHLKYLFYKHGIMITKQGFDMFNFNAGKFVLKNNVILDIKVVSYIENCYNCWHAQRHTLFHFGDIIGNTDTSRIIKNKSEANEIITKVLDLIVNNI